MRQRGDKVRPGKGRLQQATGTKAGKVRESVASNDGLNRRLRQRTRELDEALQQQAATSEVLSIIRKSPADAQPVFEAIVESAARLCGAIFSVVYLNDNDRLRFAATKNFSATAINQIKERQALRQINRSYVGGRAVLDRAIVHVPDVLADPEYSREFALAGGWRAVLAVPLLHEGKSVGAITVGKAEPMAFSEQQIQLLQTFADQAAIAIGNVRLFEEVQAKTHDLEEALQYQTGSANILKVIASSPTDVKPVLQAIVESACELCGAYDALVRLKDGDGLAFGAHHGPLPVSLRSVPISRNSTAGMAVIERKSVHVHDLLSADGDRFPDSRELLHGERTILSVPLLRENECLGAIVIRRGEVHPFSDKQIALLQTFADQAAIAIGNVRLFDEVQERTRDLQELLQQQTATADVLKVISRSVFDLHIVLQTLVESVARLCDADMAQITRQRDGVFFRAEAYGFPEEFIEYSRTIPVIPDRGSAIGRALLEGKASNVPDVLADPDYTFTEAQRIANFRAVLAVPMLRDSTPIGVIVMTRKDPRPFTEKQIGLAMTFADQAAIAIGNVQLFDEVQARTRELAKSLDDLRTAQVRLIQTEKLASLGQLTAGIAHEIKNPLNFVNNFSGMSAELLGELQDIVSGLSIDPQTHADIKDLADMLKANLEKIVQHGKRADAIVKSMLLHSGQSSGEHRLSDINALVDESLNRAYYGERAETRGFTIKLERSFDPAVGEVDLFPREISRAILNLISNSFYATRKRIETGESDYEPVLVAATRNLGDRVEIRIRDNGSGIPADVKEKMFEPFFTTKPPGEGTGLGLSITYDIIVKQHGGSIEVDTKPGEFAEIRLILPRT
jgi:two-component system, NtrC family, sensor kinase